MSQSHRLHFLIFFFQAEDGIRDLIVTGVQTCALPIFGLAVFNTLFETTVQKAVPPEALSRVASIDWMLSALLLPLGFVAAGGVAGYVGTRETLAASAVWAVVATAVVLAVPDVRNLRLEA